MEFRKFLVWLSTQGYPQDYLSKMTERTYKLHPLYQKYVASGFAQTEITPPWLAKAQSAIEAQPIPTGVHQVQLPTFPPTSTTPTTPTDTTRGALDAFKGWLVEQQGYPIESLTGVTAENYQSHSLYQQYLEGQAKTREQTQSNIDLINSQIALNNKALNQVTTPEEKRNLELQNQLLEAQLREMEANLKRSEAEAKQGSVESWYQKQQMLSEARQLEGQRFNEMLDVKHRAPKEAPAVGEDQLIKAYEAGRQEALTGLTGDRDWINQYKAKWASNPFIPSPENLARQPLEVLKEQIEHDVETVQHWDNLAIAMKANPSLGQYYQEGFTWQTALELADKAATKVTTGRETLAQLEQKLPETLAGILPGMLDERGMRQEGGRLTAPPTPAWLKEFVPGQTVGQTLKKIPLETPSGQTWTKTPFSTRQGLAGYTDWTGQKFQDLLDQQAMMLPQNPQFGSRWTPARQTR